MVEYHIKSFQHDPCIQSQFETVWSLWMENPWPCYETKDLHRLFYQEAEKFKYIVLKLILS
jgi:hypothetical protein